MHTHTKNISITNNCQSYTPYEWINDNHKSNTINKINPTKIFVERQTYLTQRRHQSIITSCNVLVIILWCLCVGEMTVLSCDILNFYLRSFLKKKIYKIRLKIWTYLSKLRIRRSFSPLTLLHYCDCHHLALGCYLRMQSFVTKINREGGASIGHEETKARNTHNMMSCGVDLLEKIDPHLLYLAFKLSLLFYSCYSYYCCRVCVWLSFPLVWQKKLIDYLLHSSGWRMPHTIVFHFYQ
jgi:hypothetical protein